ncbi:signal peptidase I [Pantoea sp. Mhis]|uniref:signal peptidase I n=1 Tax=Pantoea sp. Mhis TaxID=2576759 RepID=UPI0013575AAA|nr:signal peptidase I [Pantoea sp. Mhis]MXP56610.1 signal peptidase I [Pantoea sp. Mhis]
MTANMFALVLVIATLITGIIWCINLFNRGSIFKNQTLENSTKITWMETIASMFPVLAVVLIIRSFIFEPFQIPSGSMMPTLLVGDFILVKKFAYGIKNPITQSIIFPTGSPQRGDIAVFRYPKDPSLNYIKRIIGLPGDTVFLDAHNNTIIIYPHCHINQCNNSFPIAYSNIEPSVFVLSFEKINGKQVSGDFYQIPKNKNILNGLRFSTRKETIGNVTHSILLIPKAQIQSNRYYHQSGQPNNTWVVPSNQYFMMGDNRDNSFDSRYWGFVPRENLLGKAIAIWMSFDKQAKQWPTGVRLNRIGKLY